MKQVILISGGSDGLGKETAALLSQEHTVVILAHNPEKTVATAKALGVDFVLCDVRNAEEVQDAVEEVITKHGHIDTLVNNAGIWVGGSLEDTSYEDIDRVIDVNYKGTVLLSKAVIPHMKKAQSGTIINIVSTAGLIGKKERSIYNSSKFAVSGFTKCLQQELAPHGIRVTGLYPGPIQTQLFAKGGLDRDLTQNALPASEVASVIAYLMGRPASFLCTEMVFQHINYL